MSDKVIKNRIAATKKQSGKYPFDFKSPSYDNRSSGSISAGNNYGIGFRQPVGTHKASSIESGPIPFKCSCYDPNELVEGEEHEG